MNTLLKTTIFIFAATLAGQTLHAQSLTPFPISTTGSNPVSLDFRTDGTLAPQERSQRAPSSVPMKKGLAPVSSGIPTGPPFVPEPSRAPTGTTSGISPPLAWVPLPSAWIPPHGAIIP